MPKFEILIFAELKWLWSTGATVMLLNEALSLHLSTETRSPFNILTCKILAFDTIWCSRTLDAAEENFPVICESSIQECCPGSLLHALTFTGRVLVFQSCHWQVLTVGAADRVCGAELWYGSLSSSALKPSGFGSYGDKTVLLSCEWVCLTDHIYVQLP